MKVALVLFLVAASAFAQKRNSILPAACGPADAHFEIGLKNAKHQQAQPEPGKALIYFIQQQGSRFVQAGWAFPAVLLGIDGRWVGAYQDSSYFPVQVEPGEHRVCALLQGRAGLLVKDQVEVLHFAAQANESYYFRTRVISTPNTAYLFLDSIDSDEAAYRIALYPLALPKQRNGD